MRAILYSALAVLILIHADPFFWNDGRIVMGLPVGFHYDILYTVVGSILMTLLVKRAWPEHVDEEETDAAE